MPVVLNLEADKRIAQAESPTEPLEFHRSLPGYRPTPLVAMPTLAAELGLASLHVKDESDRLGLPSFKILGASWALRRVLLGDGAAGDADPLPAMRAAAAQGGIRELATATDGNHGRAVARLAAMLEIDAKIFVPRGTVRERIDSIVQEGGRVIVVDGSYDDAVTRAAEAGSQECVVLQDTSYADYERIPEWIVDGYATLFHEIDMQLQRQHTAPPQLVVAQIGVGSLATAAVRHFRRPELDFPPWLLGAEPGGADCVAQALTRGEPVDLPGPHRSMMAGLNAGRVSQGAWPWLRRGLDGVVVMDDSRAAQAMRRFAAEGLASGESGAAGLAALFELLDRDERNPALGGRVLLLSTEGVTDKENYGRIVG